MFTAKSFVAMATAATLGALGSPSASAKDHHERGGHVMACSLHGVNPVHHPEIFGHPDVARSYGFVQASDGEWQVESNCRRHRRV
ncbi:MAG TPA: hypothetical protein VIY51_07910 [Xanthobacteraceae bacterium]